MIVYAFLQAVRAHPDIALAAVVILLAVYAYAGERAAAKADKPSAAE